MLYFGVFLAFLNTSTTGTPFRCIVIAFPQMERRSLENDPLVLHVHVITER